MKGKSLAAVEVHPHAAFFWKRVTLSEGCWEWTGKKKSGGRYGELLLPDWTYIAAHRYSYVLHSGRTLGGDESIDHLCRNGLCVRPDHLEAVPMALNHERTRGFHRATPKRYVAKSGKVTWRVRFKEYREGLPALDRSRTFDSEAAALAWIEERRCRPLV